MVELTEPHTRRECWAMIAVWVCAWAATIISVEALAARYDGESFWDKCTLENSTWCEAKDADRSLFIIESSNARSDYSYLGIGLGMMVLGIADTVMLWQQPDLMKKTILHRYPVITFVNGCCNVVHAAGTFWNHSCECRQGGILDVAGMLSVTAFPCM
jgi:hypothetical protein